MRAPACSQAADIPIASSPERTETRPSSHAESTTVEGVEAAGRCRSRTTGRRRARPPRTAGSRRCAGRARRGAARRPRRPARPPGRRSRRRRRAPGVRPGGRRAGDLLRPRATPGPATSPTRRGPGAATAQLQPAGGRGGDGERPADEAREERPGRPASAPDGVSTSRRSPSMRQERRHQLVGDRGRAGRAAPRAAGAASAPSRCAAAMVRSEVSPSRRSRSGASGPRSSTRRVVRGDDQGGHPVPDDHGAPPGPRRPAPSADCSSSRPAGLADLARALAVPLPLAHALAQLLGPPRLRRTPTRLAVALQQPQLGEVVGDLLVGRRAHGRDPADQRAGALRPLEDQRRVAVVEGEHQPVAGEVAPVADQGALQVEPAERGLPGVQVGQPGAHVVAGVPPVAARLGELGAHLAPEQPGGDGGGAVRAAPGGAGRGRRRGRHGAR